MATVTVTPGYNWVSGEVVTPAKMNLAAQPTASVSNIVDADVSAGAAIAASKLSTIAQQSLVPAGAIMPFASSTKPAGWLEADGSVVPNGSGTVQGVTANFSALYAAVGTSFGAAGTLPDLRGIFVRGSGSQTISGTTYNKTFAAKERDALQGHRHTPLLGGGFWCQGGSNPDIDVMNNSVAFDYSATTTGNPTTDGTNGTPRTAAETRPANIALLYCIKF